ncbi:SCO family protein [Jeotgalibacillus terrae]|uniref:SCO family protein n=1 Tax=Jeotgalibacillus terrae TaxID=587735 RepID=A0ABW5ZPN0_9BACL|nr:SCO family protein [Jeotgalibacillus terrae]MBM7580489.1 protein SCO1/2 [Jeotgalibacillus terrae]
MKVLSTALFLVLFTAGVWGVWYLQTSLPVLKTIEPFQMTSVLDGGRYSSDNDRIKVVAFFYTECPDICPFTMSDLKEVYEALETEGAFDEKKVEFVSITLDPEADTDERIRRYADSFDADIKGWHWLRGTEAETADLTEEFRMRRMKVEGEIVHSTTLYLMDADHQIRGTYAMATYRDRLNREELMDDVLKLIDQ